MALEVTLRNRHPLYVSNICAYFLRRASGHEEVVDALGQVWGPDEGDELVVD